MTLWPLPLFTWTRCSRNPLAQFEEEKKEHELKMMKMQEEMEHVFEMKVMEKKQKLKDSEADVSSSQCIAVVAGDQRFGRLRCTVRQNYYLASGRSALPRKNLY